MLSIRGNVLKSNISSELNAIFKNLVLQDIGTLRFRFLQKKYKKNVKLVYLSNWQTLNQYNHFIKCVRLSPGRMGPLGKPPASLEQELGFLLLPSRARSCTRNPALFELQCRYEAIRVWSYTTFIVIKAVVNR
jgi:hypothetical protein